MKFKEIVTKLVDWLKESNRYKHLIGGVAVGLVGGSFWAGLYAGLVGASCLELKDRQWGGRWDWTDWGVTAVGAALASLVWLF